VPLVESFPVDAFQCNCALVHTHAHLDHIAATRDIKEATGAAIRLHRANPFVGDHA